ncbi:MAG TPA: His-Xaa-Ser system radical SAM maturase HxsC [Terrimicrobiaceae bacterium]
MNLNVRIEPQEGPTAIVRIGPTEGILSKGRDLLEFSDQEGFVRHVPLPPDISYLDDGDIVRVNLAGGEIRTLYRRNSRHNSLFFTERCNSRCLMCSQPPRDIDDDYLVDEMLKFIPLMSHDTCEIGITGGEPTLLGARFLEVLRCLKKSVPRTSVHVLTNGRRFKDLDFAKAVADVGHPDLVLGIPLYADVPWKHDFIVQADGAFSETVLGLLNLGRVGVSIELRFVVHRQSFDRMAETARFAGRNFPFIRQFALMGLELTGFAKSNLGALWIEPAEYVCHLEKAVEELLFWRIRPLILNHQLCTIPESLWPHTCKSISDWKNIYYPQCEECDVREDCGGFFASSTFRRSASIHPIKRSVLGGAKHAFQQVG